MTLPTRLRRVNVAPSPRSRVASAAHRAGACVRGRDGINEGVVAAQPDTERGRGRSSLADAARALVD
jgi:hypothetical protein